MSHYAIYIPCKQGTGVRFGACFSPSEIRLFRASKHDFQPKCHNRLWGPVNSPRKRHQEDLPRPTAHLAVRAWQGWIQVSPRPSFAGMNDRLRRTIQDRNTAMVQTCRIRKGELKARHHPPVAAPIGQPGKSCGISRTKPGRSEGQAGFPKRA